MPPSRREFVMGRKDVITIRKPKPEKMSIRQLRRLNEKAKKGK